MKHLERALDHQNQWWKYVAIFFAGFFVANLIGSIPLVAVIAFKTFQNGTFISPNPDNIADLSVYGISPNLGLVLLILPFIFGLITIIFLFKPLHKRTLSEVINGTNRIRWNRFFIAAMLWAFFMAVYLLIDYKLNPSNFQFNFNISAFIPLVFISLILLPFQTTFEELLFRGYLSQGIGAWTRNRWLVIIIPSILFGLMHSFNPEIKEYGFWLEMPQYVLFGLIFGLVTVLDDGIEVAMGMHAANNVFASIFITNKSSVLQTPALLNQLNMEPVRETIILLIFGVVFILILAYKYKWKFAIINKKVITPA